jgi:hypothetical protein
MTTSQPSFSMDLHGIMLIDSVSYHWSLSCVFTSQQLIYIAVNAPILSYIHCTTLKRVTQSSTAGTNRVKYMSHPTLLFTHHHLQSFNMKASFEKDISSSTYCPTLHETPPSVAYTCLYSVIILTTTSCWLAHHIMTQYIMKNKGPQYIRKSKGIMTVLLPVQVFQDAGVGVCRSQCCKGM